MLPPRSHPPKKTNISMKGQSNLAAHGYLISLTRRWQVISLVQTLWTINSNVSILIAGNGSEGSITYNHISRPIYLIDLIDVMYVEQDLCDNMI
jgi:hypothetical protein